MTAPDPAWEIANALLARVHERLQGEDRPVQRAFVAPGATAPWDTCCGDQWTQGVGQLWVTIRRVYPASVWPTQDTTRQAQRTGPIRYAAELSVSVIRCCATLDDGGDPPSAAQVHKDAAAVSWDRAAIRQELTCGFAWEDLREPDDMLLGQWVPLGPQGGCVGGQWDLTVDLPPCRC